MMASQVWIVLAVSTVYLCHCLIYANSTPTNHLDYVETQDHTVEYGCWSKATTLKMSLNQTVEIDDKPVDIDQDSFDKVHCQLGLSEQTLLIPLVGNQSLQFDWWISSAENKTNHVPARYGFKWIHLIRGANTIEFAQPNLRLAKGLDVPREAYRCDSLEFSSGAHKLKLFKLEFWAFQNWDIANNATYVTCKNA